MIFTDLLSFLLAVEGLQGFSLVSFGEGIKNPDVKIGCFETIVPETIRLDVETCVVGFTTGTSSPVECCSTGSIERFLEIGFIRLAVVSRTSSCLRIGKPPWGS